MTSKLFPTLFIGIGSTGAQILGSLQKHLFEEYQVEDFPIFHLLGLISDDSDRSKANAMYKIEWYHMQVPDTSVVKEQIENPRQDWERNLKKWLPPIVLDVPSFTDGSGGRRVAGRLHLWENYDRISQIISQAKDKIQNRNDDARRIVEERTRQDVDIDSKIKVFILGSLGGGTCSGMCIDTAFLVREIIGAQQLKSITGIFTVPNYEQARDPLLKLGSINTNSYAAVTELAYYFYYSAKNKPLHHYLRDKEIENKPPYDDVYLESCSNAKNIVLRKKHDANYDYSSLCEMIGMNLYLECGSETSSIKDGIRTDYPQKLKNNLSAEYKLPDPIIGEPRAFCSFGATSINYPQYSLARAAACDLLKERFSAYTKSSAGTGLTTNEMQKLIDEKFKNLSAFIRTKLVGDIEKQINSKLDSIDTSIMSASSSELESLLRNYPNDSNDNSFSKSFSSNGNITEELKSKIDIIKNEVITYSKQLLESFRENITSLDEYSERVKNFKERINKVASSGVKEVKIKFDELDDFINKIQEIEDDWFHAFTFSKDKSLEQRKRQLIDGYKVIVKRAFEQVRKNVSIPIYQEINNKILDLIGPSSGGIAILSERLKGLVHTFEEEKKNIFGQFHDMKHMMFCSETKLYGNGADDSQLIDWAESEVLNIVNKHRDTINETRIYTAFIDKAGQTEPTNKDFENELVSKRPGEVNEGCSKMIDELTKTIIKLNDVKINFTELFKTISDQSQRHDLEELVKRSFYYIQLDDSKYYKGDTRFINGDTKGLRIRLLPKNKFDKSSLKDIEVFKDKNEPWEDRQDLSTDHFILFYTEEPGFAPSHMDAYREWAENYEKSMSLGSSTIDLDWTEEEWRRSRIDFQKEARAEYIRFILENVNRVFPDNSFKDGDDKPFFSVWGNSNKYYFDVPRKESKLPIDIQINLENFEIYSDADKSKNNSYVQAAKTEYNPQVEDYIFYRLKTCFNCLDPESFSEKCEELKKTIKIKQMELKEEKAQGNCKLRPDELTKEIKKHQWNICNIDAFKAYVKKVIYKKELEKFEDEYLTKSFPVDDREEEEREDKSTITFRFLCRFLTKK